MPGILLHGTWHLPAGVAVDAALIFGDDSFMAALAQALGIVDQ